MSQPAGRSRASGREKVLVLVKALPHAGERHGETVCCAGITPEGQWRRQYPIHFRRLQTQFARWDWIEYDWISPTAEDRRAESRRVQEDTIVKRGSLPKARRADFLNRLVLPSTDAAAARGNSLTLVRPRSTRFYAKPKTDVEIQEERRAYERAATQGSFLDQDLAALSPCPYAFRFDYETVDGKRHKATCDDWESAAMFYRFERQHGAQGALDAMSRVFNEEYPASGMVFALGTHSRHPKTWLLVGVVRLDEAAQAAMLV